MSWCMHFWPIISAKNTILKFISLTLLCQNKFFIIIFLFCIFLIIKVIKTENTDQTSDSGVDSNTDFCSVILSSEDSVTSNANTTAGNLNINFPTPRSANSSELVVMTCNQGMIDTDYILLPMSQ